MPRIGFIFSSGSHLHDPFRGDPHTHLQILTVLEFHFGKAVDLSLIDLRGMDKRFARYHIPECDLYLYSVYTLDYNEQVSIAQTLRRRFPKAKHIAGGPHVNIFQEESLKTFDSLILGDGEESILRAVEDAGRSELKPVYREERMIDINRYPFPRRHYLPESTVAREGLMGLKHKEGYEALLSTTAIFSRGCPYHCYFCEMQFDGLGNRRIRYKEPALIEEEIEYLKREYHIQGLNLLDEIGVPLSRGRALSFLEAMGRTNVTWRGQCRVDGITPELAKLTAESGCVAMGLGVESVSQRALDMINKKILVEKAKETIALLKQNGMEVRIYMIIGLPGEPEDIVEQTRAFIDETEPDLVYLSLFTVRPGTEVFLHPERFGIQRIDTDWEHTMHMFGRYDPETPTLTFEYQRQAPWGRAFRKEEIVRNYLELQAELKERDLCSVDAVPAKETQPA